MCWPEVPADFPGAAMGLKGSKLLK
ncbi:rCG23376 [Rattus norvegicus]|uniref:RCG23376 n=1 Tax=Rattus norvegicus TaxID=10116 RepID=A6KH87_RAT|nr:rCG23376 [Rattus norvegicus]